MLHGWLYGRPGPDGLWLLGAPGWSTAWTPQAVHPSAVVWLELAPMHGPDAARQPAEAPEAYYALSTRPGY